MTQPATLPSTEPATAPVFDPAEVEFAPTEEVTITFYHTMGAALQDVLDRYIDEFNRLYPNITVVHSQIGSFDDIREQVSAEIATGEQPNIVYCYPDDVALYNRTGFVTTLDGLIAATATVTRADGTTEFLSLTGSQIQNFIPGFYEEGCQFGDGQMYTLPFSKSTEVLYYNQTFFYEHQLPVPTTWEEMETVCALIKEIAPDCIPLGYDSEANWFITMCAQLNSPYTSAVGDHFLFDNAQNRAFVKRFHDWYQKGYVTTQELAGSYTSELFTKDPGEVGNCYMCIASTTGASHQRSSEFDVGITSIPQVEGAASKVISQGPSVCILNQQDPQEVLASWLFVKFLTTNAEFQAEFSMASGYMPVTYSARENAVYMDHFLDNADGNYNIQALATKVALEQAEAYFASPAFLGSSVARDGVGLLMRKCMIASIEYIDASIAKAFKDAVAKCEYHHRKAHESYEQKEPLSR